MDNAPLLTIIALAMGGFYAVGGVLLLRRLPTEAVMDQMLAALGEPTAPAERQRTRVWMVGGTLTLASGLSLMALSRWSPVFFVVTALFQAGYLLWSSRVLPAEDEESRAGRRATVQAFVIYLAATAFVLWLDARGLWRGWLDPAFLELLALCVASTAVAAVLLRHAFWTAPAPPPVSRPGPAVLRLVPVYRTSPLRDPEEDAPIDPADLGLSGALVARIADWDAVHQAIYDDEDPFAAAFPDLATEQAWFEEGLAVAAEIQAEWTGTLKVDLSGLDTMLRYARRTLEPTDDTPLEEATAMAPRCGVAEIRDAIQRLDLLTCEKGGLADDEAPDIARDQLFLAHLLAAVSERYLPEVRRGLDSPEAETRRWAARALAMRGEG